MAKQRLYWNEDADSGILTCTEGKDGKQLVQIDLTGVYPDHWAEFNTCQKAVAFYGMKQKVSDTGAKSSELKLTLEEKAGIMQANADRIVYEGEFNAKPRKLTPLERAQRALTAYDKEVEGLCDQLKANGAADAVIDSMIETVWTPKRQELEAKVEELS